MCRPDPGNALSNAGATCLSNDGEFIQRVIHAWKGDTDRGVLFARKLQGRRCEENDRRVNRFLLLPQATIRRAEPWRKPAENRQVSPIVFHNVLLSLTIAYPPS